MPNTKFTISESKRCMCACNSTQKITCEVYFNECVATNLYWHTAKRAYKVRRRINEFFYYNVAFVSCVHVARWFLCKCICVCVFVDKFNWFQRTASSGKVQVNIQIRFLWQSTRKNSNSIYIWLLHQQHTAHSHKQIIVGS